MLPWIAMLAGTLANKIGSDSAKKNVASDIRRKQAARLGGNTDVLDAVRARQGIEAESSNNMSNMFIQQLVGQIGGKQKMDTSQAPTNDMLRGSVGGNSGLFQSETEPGSAATPPFDPLGPAGGAGGAFSPESQDEFNRRFGKTR